MLTALQKSTDGIVGHARAWLEGLNGKRGVGGLWGWSRRRWHPARGRGIALALWDERTAGTLGEDTPVGVSDCPDLNLPNRRIRDPYVRWCGRGEAVRSLPIPIRRSETDRESKHHFSRR